MTPRRDAIVADHRRAFFSTRRAHASDAAATRTAAVRRCAAAKCVSLDNRVCACASFLSFLQVVMQNIIRPNERAQNMLRVLHLNLFRIRRSLHHVFGVFVALLATTQYPGRVACHCEQRNEDPKM